MFDEEDMIAAMNGEYVVKTPSLEEEEEEETPSRRRVTWRESLEEAFYDTEDECIILDVSNNTTNLSDDFKLEANRSVTQPSEMKPAARRLRHQFSFESQTERNVKSAEESTCIQSSSNPYKVTKSHSAPRDHSVIT